MTEWTWQEGDTFKFFDPRGYYIPMKVTFVEDVEEGPMVFAEGPHRIEMKAQSWYWLQFGKEFEHGQ